MTIKIKGKGRKVVKKDITQNAMLEGYLASVLLRAILEPGVK